MRVGIDATNIGIGGGVTHLKEILLNFNLNKNESISKIVVFSSQKVLDQLPDTEMIEKITFPGLNTKLFQRILFQLFKFDKEIKKRCDILFSITGDNIGKFKPIVGMSRNMLLYERQIWKEIKQPKEILRFWINFQKQKRSFNNSEGIIFISNYAKGIVSKQLNLESKRVEIIHHGVSPHFKGVIKQQKSISYYTSENPYKLLYVSTVHVYKHQWNVIEAIAILRKKGYPIELNLLGAIIFGPAGKRLTKIIKKVDPTNTFIHFHGSIPYEEINKYYKNTDGIVFASTCENMPNILIESMSSGMPIACSNKQPMPEFLKKNGFYFNSYDINSIEKAIEQMLLNAELRETFAKNNLEDSLQYSWEKTTYKTFQFIEETYKAYYHV